MDIAEIVTALGVIILGIFQVYQYTINKTTDFKIERLKIDEKIKHKVISENVGQILGQLWKLLYQEGFDRVYIVRPHPEKKHEFVSVQFEVRRNGISSIKSSIQNQAMEEIPHFIGRLSKEDYFIISDTNDPVELQDVVARSIFNCNGSVTGVISRLENREGKWAGSLFATCTHQADLSSEEVKKAVLDCSWRIQLILPEFIS